MLNRSIRTLFRNALVLMTLLCLSLSDQAPSAAPTRDGALGQSSVKAMARTDRGEWDGTWLHVSRDFRMVVWLRSDSGKPEARVRYLGTKVPPERFDTDWDAQATYSTRKNEGRFSLTFVEADENTVVGDWRWIVDFGDSSREDIGRFTLYRGSDGRMMVFNFSEFEQIQRRGDRTDRIPFENALVFRKVSRRLVEWDAIPI
jgi:hypothetical protein